MSDTKKIMLIDDDEVNNFICEETIRESDLGVEITTYTSAEKALRFIQANNTDPLKLPDLIFLDINMPIMNGWDFIRAYRELTIPDDLRPAIIMLTSSLFEKDKDRAKQYEEIADFITKPLTTERLYTIAEKYFNEMAG